MAKSLSRAVYLDKDDLHDLSNAVFRVSGYDADMDGEFYIENLRGAEKSIGNEIFIFSAVYSDKRYDPNEVEKHKWWVIKEKSGLKFGIDESDAHSRKTLSVGEWTEVITRHLKTSDGVTVPFHFRARLDKFDEQNGKFTIF